MKNNVILMNGFLNIINPFRRCKNIAKLRATKGDLFKLSNRLVKYSNVISRRNGKNTSKKIIIKKKRNYKQKTINKNTDNVTKKTDNILNNNINNNLNNNINNNLNNNINNRSNINNNTNNLNNNNNINKNSNINARVINKTNNLYSNLNNKAKQIKVSFDTWYLANKHKYAVSTVRQIMIDFFTIRIKEYCQNPKLRIINSFIFFPNEFGLKYNLSLGLIEAFGDGSEFLKKIRLELDRMKEFSQGQISEFERIVRDAFSKSTSRVVSNSSDISKLSRDIKRDSALKVKDLEFTLEDFLEIDKNNYNMSVLSDNLINNMYNTWLNNMNYEYKIHKNRINELVKYQFFRIQDIEQLSSAFDDKLMQHTDQVILGREDLINVAKIKKRQVFTDLTKLNMFFKDDLSSMSSRQQQFDPNNSKRVFSEFIKNNVFGNPLNNVNNSNRKVNNFWNLIGKEIKQNNPLINNNLNPSLSSLIGNTKFNPNTLNNLLNKYKKQNKKKKDENISVRTEPYVRRGGIEVNDINDINNVDDINMNVSNSNINNIMSNNNIKKSNWNDIMEQHLNANPMLKLHKEMLEKPKLINENIELMGMGNASNTFENIQANDLNDINNINDKEVIILDNDGDSIINKLSKWRFRDNESIKSKRSKMSMSSSKLSNLFKRSKLINNIVSNSNINNINSGNTFMNRYYKIKNSRLNAQAGNRIQNNDNTSVKSKRSHFFGNFNSKINAIARSKARKGSVNSKISNNSKGSNNSKRSVNTRSMAKQQIESENKSNKNIINFLGSVKGILKNQLGKNNEGEVVSFKSNLDKQKEKIEVGHMKPREYAEYLKNKNKNDDDVSNNSKNRRPRTRSMDKK